MTLTAADGRTTTSALRALTWRVLPLKVAQRLAAGAAGGRSAECDESICPFDRARDCRRTAPLSVVCRRVRFDVAERPRCLGSILVRARTTGYDIARRSRCRF